MKLFDVPDNTEIATNIRPFDCSICGTHRREIYIKGVTTDLYDEDNHRRKIIEVVKYGTTCDCEDEIWLENFDVRIVR